MPVDSISSIIKLENCAQEVSLTQLLVIIPAGVLFYLPVAVKRAHDIGDNGVCVIGLLVMSLIPKILETIGYVDGVLPVLISILLYIPGILYGLLLLFKDSEAGTNEYGTSTKYPSGQ